MFPRFLDRQGFTPIGKVDAESMRVIQSFNFAYALFMFESFCPCDHSFLSGVTRYGEKPSQKKLSSQGDDYWKAMFPELDFIEKCSLVYESEADSTATVLPSNQEDRLDPISKSDKHLESNPLAPKTGESVKKETYKVTSKAAAVAGFLGTLGLVLLFVAIRKFGCLRSCSIMSDRTVYQPVEVTSLVDGES